MASPWRLLLVDDDTAILELLELRLKRLGYEIQTALNGEMAYEKVSTFQPHVIVCDVVMPVMDGPTFCRKVRAEGVSTPFLFLTAKGQPRDKVDALSAGADDYLVKPFDAQELAARLQAILRRV